MDNQLVEIKNVTKAYVKGKKALDNISLNFEAGKIIGLLGPNGSGKSTMIKILTGVLVADEGQITVDGKKTGIESKKIVSYLPERTYLDASLRVKDMINFFKDFYEDFNEERCLDMFNKLDINITAKIKTLSKGTREKVQLVLVMSRDAKLYILDEPIGGVDPAARDFILKTILTNYNEDASIIICTHLISDIEQILDHVVFIKNGEIKLDGDAEEIRAKEGKSIDKIFREVFAC